MVHRHSIFTTLTVLVVFLTETTTAEISTTCFSALPSLPICAQCPGQDILLIGNCPTTDVAACVCKDGGLTSQFFDLLYQGCSPPNVKSTSTYEKAAQKFIDICAKEGYTISDSKHDGSGSTTSSTSVTPFLSTSPPRSTVNEPAGSISHNSGATAVETANTKPTSSAGGGNPTPTPTSKSSAASRIFGIGIGSQMGWVITGMFSVLILLL